MLILMAYTPSTPPIHKYRGTFISSCRVGLDCGCNSTSRASTIVPIKKEKNPAGIGDYKYPFNWGLMVVRKFSKTPMVNTRGNNMISRDGILIMSGDNFI